VYRFFRDTDGDGIDILLLSLADYLAARGPFVDEVEWKNQTELIKFILNERQRQENKLRPPRLIDGHELMQVFHLTPGPLIGKLLNLVHEAQAVGEVNSKDEAISLIRQELEDLTGKR
jgi:hypothetical protein